MAGVNDYLTCAVCLEWFKSPRRLPCHHVYCLECLQGLEKPNEDFIKCPECRQTHVIPKKRVENFKVDGRMEQLIEKQTKQKHESYNVKHYSMISGCEHSQPACHSCQDHRAQLLETLIQESRQFQNDFLTKDQMTTRRKQTSGLLRYQKNLDDIKTKIAKEFDDMIQELDKRKRSLLSGIEKEEKLILDHLSKLDQVNTISVHHETLMADLVFKVLPTKTLVSLSKQIVEQTKLMTSINEHSRQNTRITNANFNNVELMAMIDSYGELISDIDYQGDFRIMRTVDGSECGDGFSGRMALTVCPFTDNVYVSDKTSVRVYNNEGKYQGHVVTDVAPSNVAIDGNQRIIVIFRGQFLVNIFNRGLQLIKSFGSYGDENGEFMKPIAVACDVDNNIYVVDMDKKSIQRFKPDGTFKSEIGRDVLQGPVCVQINQRQELLVSDKVIGQVVIFSRNGQHLRSFLGDWNFTTMCRPFGICVDSKGHILVADSGNQMIRVYNDDGTHHCNIREPAAAMTKMFGLAVTSSGVIFITDGDENNLHMIVNKQRRQLYGTQAAFDQIHFANDWNDIDWASKSDMIETW